MYDKRPVGGGGEKAVEKEGRTKRVRGGEGRSPSFGVGSKRRKTYMGKTMGSKRREWVMDTRKARQKDKIRRKVRRPGYRAIKGWRKKSRMAGNPNFVRVAGV